MWYFRRKYYQGVDLGTPLQIRSGRRLFNLHCFLSNERLLLVQAYTKKTFVLFYWKLVLFYEPRYKPLGDLRMEVEIAWCLTSV